VADQRSYAKVAEEFGLTPSQVKNIKLKASRDIRRKRLQELKDEAKRLRDALIYFSEMDAMNPPSGIRPGDWLAGVTSARAALKGAE
jgi:SpoVK/Ycf46/Vps4 family AAA+-type ATPase